MNLPSLARFIAFFSAFAVNTPGVSWVFGSLAVVSGIVIVSIGALMLESRWRALIFATLFGGVGYFAFDAWGELAAAFAWAFAAAFFYFAFFPPTQKILDQKAHLNAKRRNLQRDKTRARSRHR